MTPSDWELFYGKGARRPDQPPPTGTQPPATPSMSFTDAFRLKSQYGPDAILPPDMRAFALEELRRRAEEEERPHREALARADEARAAIRAHGGDILLANRREGGLRVTVVLPHSQG